MLSPEKNAITTFVSRRILPGIRIDFFAAFLDGLRHCLEVRAIDAALEAGQTSAGCSVGGGQAAREIQNLTLQRSVQTFDVLDDLVFDGLGHDEINVGNGFPEVKSVSKSGADGNGPSRKNARLTD